MALSRAFEIVANHSDDKQKDKHKNFERKRKNVDSCLTDKTPTRFFFSLVKNNSIPIRVENQKKQTETSDNWKTNRF